MSDNNLHQLAAHGYDLTIDAAQGASLTSFRCRMPDGTWFEVLHPCPPAVVARTGGSFVMAPFTNRLDGGRFSDARGIVDVPLNRPEQALAIHGFSRDRAWRMVGATDDTLRLVDDFSADGIAFAYSLTQTITITAEGVDFGLHLTNNADRVLPYGIGYHPWFRKEAETWLTLDAATGFTRDERGFAALPASPTTGPDFANGVDVATIPWFDGHFSGWTRRQAVIEWRRERAALRISASGAFANVHVYVPDTLPVVCVEPVSHVPDVHNRRELADHGDVTWLAPGEHMEGVLSLSFASLPADIIGAEP